MTTFIILATIMACILVGLIYICEKLTCKKADIEIEVNQPQVFPTTRADFKKLNNENLVAAVRSLNALGLSQRQIAKDLHVHQKTIWRIMKKNDIHRNKNIYQQIVQDHDSGRTE